MHGTIAGPLALEPLALLDPLPPSAERQDRIRLACLNVRHFARPPALLRQLREGRQFSALALSLDGSPGRVAANLAQILELAGTSTPVLLMLTLPQIDLAKLVMGKLYHDTLLAPVDDAEMIQRLVTMLNFRYLGLTATATANATSPARHARR